MKPATVLLLLVALGIIAGGVMWPRSGSEVKQSPEEKKSDEPAVASSSVLDLAAPSGPVLSAADALQKQVTILEGQVEYLQGQVKALQDENATLIQKLGSLGMKGSPMSEKSSVPTLKENGEPPDYVSLGVDLLSLRKLRAVPMAVTTAPQAEVEKMMLAWLKQRFPGDESNRFSNALHALGAIPEAIDILPLRAALMVRQISGWYDAEKDTAFLVDPVATPPEPTPMTDPVMALSYAQMMREFQKTIFGEAATGLTTDQRLAREALIGGDAALTRFLYSLQKPVPVNASDLPPSDPDHPFNQVPLPVFLREMQMFPSTNGFQFAQSLHSAGEFKQLSSAYSRPPASTMEIIDPEIYLAENAATTAKIDWPDVSVGAAKPYWQDTLGRFATMLFLRAHNPDETAFDATKGWQTDRLLAFAAEGKKRDHAVWQTLWGGSGPAQLFFKAMRISMLQRYDQPADAKSDAAVVISAQDRFIRLSLTHQGTGVLLIDAATDDFLKAAVAKFDGAR